MLHKRPLMSLKSSLYLGFGFVVLLSILITGIGIQKVGFINDRLIEINRYNAVRVATATDMRGAVQARSIALRELIHVVDSKVHYPLDTLKIEAKNYQAAREKLQENMQDAEHTSDEEKKILAEIDKHALEAMEIIQTTIAERAKGSQEETHPHTHHVVVDRGRVVFDNWAKDIRDFIRYQQSKNQIAVDEVSATSEGFRNLMILLTAFAVAVSLFIAFWIARYVYKHLGGEPYYAASMVYKIAHGDLTEKINVVHPKSMLAAVVFMQTNLKNTFQKLLDNEQRLSQRTKLVFQSSQAAQRAAENQSEISHETEASIKQISDSIQSISDIAKHTETNSAETSKLSESGSELVRSAAKEVANVTRLVNLSSSQIAELKVSTQEIGGIADVIKEIAEQTNLLALNAAIEAARAGESGQGFGVVADEVRRLADRTSKATAGISQMIDTIQQETLSTVESMADVAPQVEKGLHLANEATAMLVKIYEQAVQSTSYAHEVADAADKQVSQAMSIYQLMEIISQKSSETNQLMTENTEAVHELEDIAKNLLELLKDYKI